MKKDPILEEVRRVREAYAARFDFDPAKIVADLQRKAVGKPPTIQRRVKPAKRTRRAS